MSSGQREAELGQGAPGEHEGSPFGQKKSHEQCDIGVGISTKKK